VLNRFLQPFFIRAVKWIIGERCDVSRLRNNSQYIVNVECHISILSQEKQAG